MKTARCPSTSAPNLTAPPLKMNRAGHPSLPAPTPLALFFSCLLAALLLSACEPSSSITQSSTLAPSLPADAAIPPDAPKIWLKYHGNNLDLSAPDTPLKVDNFDYYGLKEKPRVWSDQPDYWRVEQCLETSLSFTAEGPHVDLIEWRHGYTNWWQPARDAAGNYLIKPEQPLDLNDINRDPCPFPRVTEREVLAAASSTALESSFVRYYLKRNKWDPDNPPAGVSAIILRLSVKEGGAWKPVRLIRILVPMGC